MPSPGRRALSPQEVGGSAPARYKSCREFDMCLVCAAKTIPGKEPEDKRYLFCRKHLDEWGKHWDNDQHGAYYWAEHHPDGKNHPALPKPTCPRCHEAEIVPPDYLCEGCRYG